MKCKAFHDYVLINVCYHVGSTDSVFNSQSMAWRKEFGADTILDWEAPEVLKKFYPGGPPGHCKEGYPVWIDVLGTVDLKGKITDRRTDISRYM